MTKIKNEEEGKDFEQILDRLESIAEKLDGGETKLEEALVLFQEGVELARIGNRRLESAEKKLEILLGDEVEEMQPSAVSESE